ELRHAGNVHPWQTNENAPATGDLDIPHENLYAEYTAYEHQQERREAHPLLMVLESGAHDSSSDNMPTPRSLFSYKIWISAQDKNCNHHCFEKHQYDEHPVVLRDEGFLQLQSLPAVPCTQVRPLK
ncbi:MAG: hypothetical protein R8K22_07420, partial [Mariprofundaceae bacterium]